MSSTSKRSLASTSSDGLTEPGSCPVEPLRSSATLAPPAMPRMASDGSRAERAERATVQFRIDGPRASYGGRKVHQTTMDGQAVPRRRAAARAMCSVSRGDSFVDAKRCGKAMKTHGS
eukprot:s1465_g1.t1